MEHSSSELKRLADRRLAEAEALIEAREWSGARYLAGYAIEFGLKAKAAQGFRRNHIPDKSTVAKLYNHHLEPLMKLAGLDSDLDQRVKSDSRFAANWGIASKWNVEDRYRSWSEADARSMVTAVGDPNEGILPWVKTHL